MCSVTSACLCWTLLSVCVLVWASEEQKTITAESGQNVTLTCGVPTGKTMKMLNWSRADLGERYVFLFRNGQSDPDNQHPSFKNRVDLQMKEGNLSVILKDVTAADEGQYHCQVLMEETRSLELISIINLRVVAPPGPGGGTTEDGEKEDGSVGLIVGLSVAALLLVAAVGGFLIYRKHKQSQDSY